MSGKHIVPISEHIESKSVCLQRKIWNFLSRKSQPGESVTRYASRILSDYCESELDTGQGVTFVLDKESDILLGIILGNKKNAEATWKENFNYLTTYITINPENNIGEVKVIHIGGI